MIRRHLWAVAFIAGACGCSSDDDQGSADRSLDAGAGDVDLSDVGADLDGSEDTEEETNDSINDSEARVDCAAFASPVELGELPPEVDEASGLEWSELAPEVLWVHNDSGDQARVYALSLSGELIATLTLAGVSARDFEDMSIGRCAEGTCIYVGDIGDNARSRSSIEIHRFRLPEVLSGDASVEVETIRRAYPDGPRDAEALVVDGSGDVYVLSKESGEFGVYRTSFDGGSGVMAAVGRTSLSGIPMGAAQTITAADWSAEYGLLIRTYATVGHAPDALLDAPESWRFESVPTGLELQGETVAWRGDGYVHVSEGSSPPIHGVSCER